MLCELDDLFSKLSDKDRLRIICHYVLGLSEKQIADIQECQRTTITMSFIKADKKLADIRTHNDLIAALQALFEN